MADPIKVPSAGEPELSAAVVTDENLRMVLRGLMIPSQGFSKAMARRLLALGYHLTNPSGNEPQ